MIKYLECSIQTKRQEDLVAVVYINFAQVHKKFPRIELGNFILSNALLNF